MQIMANSNVNSCKANSFKGNDKTPPKQFTVDNKDYVVISKKQNTINNLAWGCLGIYVIISLLDNIFGLKRRLFF